MSEENMTQTPGLTLPDDAAPAGQLTASDRLLAFSEGGEPVTATARQVSDYVQGQIPYVGENLIRHSIVGIYTPSWEGFLAWTVLSEPLVVGHIYVYSTDSPIKTAVLTDGYGFGTNEQTVESGVPFLAQSASKSIYISGGPGNNIGSHIKLERGTKATVWLPAPADMTVTLPASLTEQLVPGEVWLCADGVTRQVYIKTFRGTMPAGASMALASGIYSIQYISGDILEKNGTYRMPFNSAHWDNPTPQGVTGEYLATVYVASGGSAAYVSYSADGLVPGSLYSITIKYTKA